MRLNNMNSKYKTIIILYCAGLIIGSGLWLGTYHLENHNIIPGISFVRIFLFPPYQFIYLSDISHTFIGYTISFFQYPLYFVLIGAFRNTRWRRTVIAVLVAIHLLVFSACFLPDDFYEYMFWQK